MSSYEHEPTAEKGYPKYESHEDYMKRRMREEDTKLGVSIEYNNMRLTKEIIELKKEIKRLQTHCNMI
jgi:hypothetical protein